MEIARIENLPKEVLWQKKQATLADGLCATLGYAIKGIISAVVRFQPVDHSVPSFRRFGTALLAFCPLLPSPSLRFPAFASRIGANRF